MQVICNPKAIEYYYNMKTVCFVSDYPAAFLDGKCFPLEKTPKAVGGDVLVAATDLEKIFAPEMTYISSETGGTFTMNGVSVQVSAGSREIQQNEVWISLADFIEMDQETLYVPAGQIMGKGFGKHVLSSKNPDTTADPMNWPISNTIVEISHDKLEKLENSVVRNIHIQMRGKSYGELRRCYWMEDARKVLPYNLYVPSKYSPERPSKLVVALHGGRVSEEFIFEKSENRIQYLCEKYNYILLCPNACIVDCTYGCMIPNYQFLENGGPLTNNEENPMGYSPEVIQLMKLGEQDVLNTIELVKRDFNIDEKHIYMLGNSMGGIGTFHFAASFPGLLRAIAPGGGCPHMGYFKPERLGSIPIHFVYGSEDDWGSDLLDSACNKMWESGCNLEVEIIGGGRHGDAWIIGLENSFLFFERNA